MPKLFDATLKELVGTVPAGWPSLLGLPTTGPVRVEPSDLSAVTAAADVLLRAGDTLIHIEFESGPDEHLARRLLLYNALAHHRSGLPVHTAVVLLRPEADRRDLDGRLRYAVDEPTGGLDFRFQVLRLWQMPMEELLNGPAGPFLLSVLGRPPAGQTRWQALPDVVRRIRGRIGREFDRPTGDKLDTVVRNLLELIMDRERMALLEAAIARMDPDGESVYADVLREKFEKNKARQMLLNIGTAKFGPPADAQRAKLDAIDDLDRLDRLALRLLKVESWDALLRGR